MALKMFVDKLEDVPEAFRDLYIEKDGKFQLDVEGGIEDVSGLKSALGRVKNEAASLKEMVKKFKELGIEDPEKLAADLKELADLRQIDPKSEAGKLAEARIKQLTAEMNVQHQKALDAERGKTAKYRSQLEEREIISSALQAITEHKGRPKLLLPLVKAVSRLKEDENGRFRTEIIDHEGNPRFNRKGDYLTISELVEEMKTDAELAAAFEATNKQGSGAPPAGEGRGNGRSSEGGKIVISMEDARSGRYIEEMRSGKAVVESPKK